MKRLMTLAMTVLLSGVCTSCYLFIGGPTEMKDSYAGGYYEFKGLKATMMEMYGYNCVVLGDTEDVICSWPGSKNAEVFDSIAGYYGDHGYHRKSYMSSGGATNNIVNAMHIVSLDVVCMEDYNDTHKAGSSLNDIVYITSTSPYRYIKSGYRQSVKWKERINSCSDRFKTLCYERYVKGTDELTGYGLSPVDCMLDEVDPEDFPMMGSVSNYSLYHMLYIAILGFVENMTCEMCPVRFTVTLASGEEMSCELNLRRWCWADDVRPGA